jgi:DNA-directed RNA polymerase subunit K/omega
MSTDNLAEMSDTDLEKNIDESSESISLSEPEYVDDNEDDYEDDYDEQDNNNDEEDSPDIVYERDPEPQEDPDKIGSDIEDEEEDEEDSANIVYERDNVSDEDSNKINVDIEEPTNLDIPAFFEKDDAEEEEEQEEEEEEEEKEKENIDDDDDDIFKKLENDINSDKLLIYHPELLQSNYKEINALSKIARNKQGLIIDPLHRTIPFLTKYERARILGIRIKQLNNNADAFIEVPPATIDARFIAEEELKQKKLPFIIRRPLPNGGNEYWKLSDLELIEY